MKLLIYKVRDRLPVVLISTRWSEYASTSRFFSYSQLSQKHSFMGLSTNQIQTRQHVRKRSYVDFLSIRSFVLTLLLSWACICFF